MQHHLVLYRDGKDVPTAIRGRERDLFGNIEGLMLFHREYGVYLSLVSVAVIHCVLAHLVSSYQKSEYA